MCNAFCINDFRSVPEALTFSRKIWFSTELALVSIHWTYFNCGVTMQIITSNFLCSDSYTSNMLKTFEFSQKQTLALCQFYQSLLNTVSTS